MHHPQPRHGQRNQRPRNVHRFEAVNGKRTLPHRARRPGDVASCYADPSKAFEELGWKAVKTLDDMVRDSWMWQLKGAKN
ncbi:MAG: GDP-mannose 4,6-dehydratase [Bilophila wadsworthia]